MVGSFMSGTQTYVRVAVISDSASLVESAKAYLGAKEVAWTLAVDCMGTPNHFGIQVHAHFELPEDVDPARLMYEFIHNDGSTTISGPDINPFKEGADRLLRGREFWGRPELLQEVEDSVAIACLAAVALLDEHKPAVIEAGLDGPACAMRDVVELLKNVAKSNV